MTNKHKGSTFDSFLREEKLLNESEAVAVKRIIAYQLEQIMKEKNLTKSQIAEKMHTSRSAVERVLNPRNVSVTLRTLVKIAHILGKKIRLNVQ